MEELAWLYSASPHNAAYLGPHLIFPSSCGGLSKISMQSLHYYYSSNNAIRQSHFPTRSLGRSVGRSISHLSTHRRRRNKAVASCYVTWLASAKYTLDHAQPFGRGTCKKKMIAASNCSTTRKCIDENCGRSFRWTSSVGYTLLVYCFP